MVHNRPHILSCCICYSPSHAPGLTKLSSYALPTLPLFGQEAQGTPLPIQSGVPWAEGEFGWLIQAQGLHEAEPPQYLSGK